MNLISGRKNCGFAFLVVILSSYSLGALAKSIASDHGVHDLFEKLNLSQEPNHHDDEDYHHSNPPKSEPSYNSHHKEPRGYEHEEHGYGYEPEEEGEVERNVATNCREFINKKAKTSSECIFRSKKHHEPHARAKDENIFDKEAFKIGRCRWDHKESKCYCPRSQEMCYDKKLKEKCYWHEEPEYYYDYDGYKVEKEATHGDCISNAERFYNILHKLLIKRGKKDFAIRLNYNSIPARSELPYGPHGPSIINYGTSSRHSAYNKYFTLTDHHGDGSHTPYGGSPYGGVPHGGYSSPAPAPAPAPYMTPYSQSYESSGSAYGGAQDYGYGASDSGYGGSYREPTSFYGSAGVQSGGYDSGAQSYGSSYGEQSSAYESQPSYSNYESQPSYTQSYGGSQSQQYATVVPETYSAQNNWQTAYPSRRDDNVSYGSYGSSQQESYGGYGTSAPQPEYAQQPSYDYAAPVDSYASTSIPQPSYAAPSYDTGYGAQNSYNNQMPSNSYDTRQPSYSNSPLPQANYGYQQQAAGPYFGGAVGGAAGGAGGYQQQSLY